jgi:hypothetical protein
VPYVDLNTIHNPATGTVAPAAWGDQVRDDLEFLIDPPVVSAFHSTTQSLTSGSAFVLQANSENFDNDAMHSTVTNNSRITATTAGRYFFSARVSFAANVTGIREVRFGKNSTFTTALNINAAGAGATIITTFTTFVMAAGDFCEVAAQQTSGGALATQLLEFTAIFLTR